MPEGTGGLSYSAEAAIFFMLVMDVISESCSSPQTAEINIGTREETLMKWVLIGLVTSGVLLVAAIPGQNKGRRSAPVVGGGLAILLVWGQYSHARTSGLKNGDLPGTEQNYA